MSRWDRSIPITEGVHLFNIKVLKLSLGRVLFIINDERDQLILHRFFGLRFSAPCKLRTRSSKGSDDALDYLEE